MDRRTFMKSIWWFSKKSMPIVGSFAKPLKSETVHNQLLHALDEGHHEKLYEMVMMWLNSLKEGKKYLKSLYKS